MMSVILFKRIALGSVTLIGGYITFSFANGKIRYVYKEIEKPCDLSSYINLPENEFNHTFDPDENKEVKFIPTYWKLVSLSKSKDIKIRHKAVEFMSKTSFENWEYVAIAQACNIDTAIGIARSHHAESQIFLPPYKYFNMIDPQREMYKIVISLPDFDDCGVYLKEKVKQKAYSLFKYNKLEVEEEPMVLFHSQQKRKTVLKFNEACLQAVLYYSSTSHLRNLIMKKDILKPLLKLQQNHKNESNIESLIAQFLAKIALEERYRKLIFLTGWIGILSEWTKSPNIEVNLPAAKALANLDIDDVTHPIYDDGIFLLTPFERLSQKNVKADVILVHGFRGGAFHTWRQHDSQNVKEELPKSEVYQFSTSKLYSNCWPKDWLPASIPSLRMIAVDFQTCITSYDPCCFKGTENEVIDKRAAQITQKLLFANVGDKPVIWIAHSMGGLIIKKILIEANKSQDDKVHSLAKNTVGIVFYSVPHAGVDFKRIADIAAIFLRLSTEVSVLGSSILISLHAQFKDFVSEYDIPILSFGETKKTRMKFFEYMLVPPALADPGIGEFYDLPTDHLSSCKPVSPDSFDYLKVLEFMQRITKNLSPSHASKMEERENIFETCKILSLIP